MFKSRLHRLCSLIALVVFGGGLISAQTVDTIDPALKARIDRVAEQVLALRGIPSASIAVVEGNKLVYTHAYGFAHLDPNVPATPEMRYSIGSISKQFAATAILLLQEQGKLSLDDPVGKYVQGLTRGNEVTIREILSHTSGYQDYAPEDYPVESQFGPVTPRQILDTWATKPLDFDPGTQWQYSNTNYVIAGLIIEKVSGQKLFDFLGEHIFHPLGMKSAWNSDEKELTRTDSAPYMRAALGPPRPVPNGGQGWMFAAGELAMTPHDLALWNISILQRSILKPESYKEMFTEVKLKNGEGTHYGLGVEVTERSGLRSIEHSGEVNGFVSDNEVLIDNGIAVSVVTNHMAGGAEEIAQLAAATVAGNPNEPPAEKQAREIYRSLQKGEIDRALLAQNLSAYFNAQTLADYRESLGPLGDPPIFHMTRESLRGGMNFRVFQIVYPGKRLSLTTYTYPDGKLEQYLVAPAD
ncbi:MAG TPA: serine hydrolase domain-containing protein [Terracidiphilus sp.]|jgi:CubicO group peptidase (beta-lactamase class C family)|nr:serine hydrolase domain-containing protein [Terracidiphilus sp.]